MANCMLIHPSGMVEVVDFPEKDKLDWYYEKIGCGCIDIVKPYGLEDIAKKYDLKSLLGKFCLIVDDEGLLKDKPEVNPIASLLYGADTHGQCLFGKVLVAADEVTEDSIETVGFEDSDLMLLKVSINSLIEQHNEKVREAHG